MSWNLTSRQFAQIAAIGLFVAIVALAFIWGRRGDDSFVLAPLEPQRAEVLSRELVRCRTVSPDEAALLETCRRAWAQNHRQFFGPARPPKSSAGPVSNTPAELVKNQVLPREVGHQQGEVR